jgi:hypothetical protein
MLYRFLLVALLVAVSAGFTVPQGPISISLDEQTSPQAPASDCSSDPMPAGTCTVACHAGSCIAPTFIQPQPALNTAQPLPHSSARRSDRVRAPDTAPPKHSIG